MESATRHKTSSGTSGRKPQIPFNLRLIQWAFPKFESVVPQAAHKWFVNLFFSPPKYPIPSQEKEILQRANQFIVPIGQKEVVCYTWGEGPVILLVHGWAGRASQFKSFVDHFTTAGYRTISFDAPAHGLSKGKETTIIDFKDTILELEKRMGKIHAVIGHSLGGAASLYALSEGLNVNTLITIATPSIGDEIIQEFASRLNASVRAQQFLKQAIQLRLNRTFDEFMALHFIKKLPREIDMLILHDEHDKEASLKNAKCLADAYPQATYEMTSGLGHVRILRDKAILDRCKGFIESPKKK